ncbi:MAG TPA: UbiD family decarboxylase [Chloroflexota bacterium]|nr:UbiD family decarboxylase [Chloroflexota bacterium]
MSDNVDLRLRTALQRLDAAGRLLKIETEVDPILELAGVAMKLDAGPALLFENVTGYDVPVFANALASNENILAVFNTDIAGVRQVMGRGLTEPHKPVMADVGPSQEEVVDSGINLEKLLPILKHAEGDGGRYLSSGVVLAKDPDTGQRNCSFHRFEIIGPNQALIQLDSGRHLRAIWQRAKDNGLPSIDVAICLGSDLSVNLAALAMGSEVPLGRDELEIAGGFRGAPLPLVKCKTFDGEVPAEAEVIVEASISTQEEIEEGPFVEFIGYYSEVDPAPLVTFNCVTHRRDPIYYPIIGVEKLTMSKLMREAALLRAMKSVYPGVIDCEMTRGGLHRFHLVVSIRKARATEEGMQRNAAIAAITALKDLDCIILVDDDIDIRDPHDVEFALATRLRGSDGLVMMPGFRTHEYLVDAADHGVRTKIIMDTTRPYKEGGHEPRVQYLEVDVNSYTKRQEPDAALIERLLRGRARV